MYMGRKAEPKANKRLHELEIDRRMKAMKDRISNMKPSVDNKPPKHFGEVRRNVKKEQLLEERYAQIEHENRVLLARMSDIMSKPGLETTTNSLQYVHSLNRTNRKKELQRITEENQRILSRIQNARPGFDNAKLDEEAVEHARLVESITEYHSRPIGGSYRDMPLPGRSRRARSEGATGGRRGGEVDSLAGGASMYQEQEQGYYMGSPGPMVLGQAGAGAGGYQQQLQGGYPGQQPIPMAYPMGAYALAPSYGRPAGGPMYPGMGMGGAQASPMGAIAPLSYGGVTGAAAYPIPTYASMGAPMVLSPGATQGGGPVGAHSIGMPQSYGKAQAQGQGQGRPPM